MSLPPLPMLRRHRSRRTVLQVGSLSLSTLPEELLFGTGEAAAGGVPWSARTHRAVGES